MPEKKKIPEKKENTAAVLGGDASLAGAKLSKKSVKKAKLPPKDKFRLPRRQKKAEQKATGRL